MKVCRFTYWCVQHDPLNIEVIATCKVHRNPFYIRLDHSQVEEFTADVCAFPSLTMQDMTPFQAVCPVGRARVHARLVQACDGIPFHQGVQLTMTGRGFTCT